MSGFKFWISVAVVLLVAGLTACDSSMTIPVYLKIDSTHLSTTYYTQGTASSAISDIWVTINGKNMGVYELPATIPLYASGKTTVQLTAGIKLSGLSIYRPYYPFYTVDIREMDMVPTQVYELTPSFTYKEGTEFAFREDFEDAGINFEPVDKSVPISKTSDPALVFTYLKENSRYSGIIQLLPEDSTYFEVQTTRSFTKKLTYCFLEMNYYFTHDVEMGIYYHYQGKNYQCPIKGIYGSGPISGKPEWKKIYLNLTETLNSSTLITDFEIYFKGIKNKKDTAVYLFDNIKVLYI